MSSKASFAEIQQQQDQENLIQKVLHLVGVALNKLDETLNHLEENADLLPTAIMRKSQEVAHSIGSLADELDRHSPEQQERMAQECFNEYNRSLAMVEEGNYGTTGTTATTTTASRRIMLQQHQPQQQQRLSIFLPTTQEDVLTVIQGASPLLRDIQLTFQELSQDDVEDLADAALTLARLFYVAFKSFYSTLTPHDLLMAANSNDGNKLAMMMMMNATTNTTVAFGGTSGGVFIEEIKEDAEELLQLHINNNNNKPSPSKTADAIFGILSSGAVAGGAALPVVVQNKLKHEMWDRIPDTKQQLVNGISGAVVQEEPHPEPQQKQSPLFKKPSRSSSSGAAVANTNPPQNMTKVRVLWPRLGPHVDEVLRLCQEEASKKPVLAVALGLTFWPAAVVTTILGGSMVMADHFVQDIYDQYQQQPFLASVEEGAGQIVQASKLSLVVTSIVAKQTVRVVQRQLKRRGGIEQIANSGMSLAMERVTHPIETVGMAWNSLVWTVSTVKDLTQHVLQQREEFLKAVHQTE